jgi:acetolactate synthase regulatory subunit
VAKIRSLGPGENHSFNSDAMPAPRYLNADGEKFRLELKMRRSLGIIARVALVFSRRGLDIAQFRLDETKSYEKVLVTLEFRGSTEQLRAVTGDLSKLIEVESLQELPNPSLNHLLPSLTQMQAALTC